MHTHYAPKYLFEHTIYEPVRIHTSRKDGTDTTAPVSRVALFEPAPEAVLPLTPGGVSVI